jgi:putative membrane protein
MMERMSHPSPPQSPPLPGSPSTTESTTEPDPRFTLANERTFLAWIRTSLALIAGGVALAELGTSLEPRWLRIALSVAPILTGAVLSVLAYRHWRGVDRALQTESPLPRPRFALSLTGLVLVAGLVLSVTLVLT